LVLAEAMAAGLAIVASSSGAIPEVLTGSSAKLFRAGDWMEIARLLAAGPLLARPAERVEYPPELVARYSTHAAAQRLADAYDRVLSA
jgi:glycosyltransferase involved in cell wall biosynthesis